MTDTTALYDRYTDTSGYYDTTRMSWRPGASTVVLVIHAFSRDRAGNVYDSTRPLQGRHVLQLTWLSICVTEAESMERGETRVRYKFNATAEQAPERDNSQHVV